MSKPLPGESGARFLVRTGLSGYTVAKCSRCGDEELVSLYGMSLFPNDGPLVMVEVDHALKGCNGQMYAVHLGEILSPEEFKNTEAT